MDHRRENRSSSEDVVNVLSLSSRNGMNESWGNGYVDQAVWATEDEYGMWNQEPSSEQPSKRSRSSNSDVGASSNRSRAIGKMFYKTKMCCKFRAGTCPYVTNCNFAHSVEELRKTPENWQETVAAHEEEPREEFQIPIAGADVGVGVGNEMQRSSKGRHCKKFYTEEGCPYGESCTFLHDEHSRARESVAISLGPGGGIGGSGGGSILKPSNWKTRICNKWELTGFCPFGSKCLFAHGAAEMNHFGGGPVDLEVKDSSNLDSKQGLDSVVGSASLSEGYHMGIPSQRLCNVIQRSGLRLNQKWKGPDKISKIYGDWIDDL